MRNPYGTVSDALITGAPTKCPACGASDVTTTSKTVSAETYWRCVSCGEVWNVARRAPGTTRVPMGMPFRGGSRRRR